MSPTLRDRLATALLCAWPHAHWALPAIAAVTILIGHRELLAPVIDNGGDNASHMLAEYALAHALDAGDNLLGPLPLDFGLPILRFYQSLFYLTNVALNGLTGVDLRLIHNLIVAVCFTLSPFSFCYFLLRLGLRRFAAGCGSLLAITSVGSFGNSFEAYHGIGIATQSMGALFFPLFMGQLVGLLRGESRWPPAALAFAAAFLSHAMMAVYAVLAGVLYLLVAPVRLGPNLRRLTLFALFSAALVSFWALPFVSHTAEHRAVPDSITRGQVRRWWFTSVDEHEMVQLAASGRLLDDPREFRSRQTDPLDQLMERVTMGVTVRTRFPHATLLAGLGLLVALLRFRRAHCRFLASGFAFSLFLFTGPDDFPLLARIPLFGNVQTFRSTYLVEFFAYGLAGLGVEAVLRAAWSAVATGGRGLRYGLGGALCVAIAAGIVACVAEISLLARVNVRVHEQTRLDAWLDANGSLANRGYPFRVLSMERWNSYRAWLVAGGFRAPCSHWGAIAPTTSLYLCHQTRDRPRQVGMHALAGIRYVSGNEEGVAKYLAAADREGQPLYQQLPLGRDRRGHTSRGRYILDSGEERFLRPVPGWPLPVVCDDRQWLWIVDGWMARYGLQVDRRRTPIPMRVRPGELGASGLLEQARAVLYLERSGAADDGDALRGFAAAGGRVVAPFDIDGIDERRASPERPIWAYLPRLGRLPAPAEVEITRYDDPRRSSQRYHFDADALAPTVAVLPTAAVPGWTARIDGDRASVFAAGPDMLGVLLPAGSHRVEFEWRMPGWQAAALAASLIALVLTLAAWLLGLAARLILNRALARTLGAGGG